MNELKPCPFCGTDKLHDRFVGDEDGGYYEILCATCSGGHDRFAGTHSENRELALAAWNTRPPSLPGREEVARITDEMVEAAAKELQRHAWPDCSWDGIHESGRERYRRAARDGLNEAIALISNGPGEREATLALACMRLQAFLDTFGDLGGCETQADLNDWLSLANNQDRNARREQYARIIYSKTRQQYRHAPQPEPVSFDDAGGVSREVCYAAADALLALDSQDRAAQREPVAWLYEVDMGGGHWSQRYTDAKPAGNGWQRNIRPLYLHPDRQDRPLPNMPKPETLRAYASILEKPQYNIKDGIRYKTPTGEVIEAACAALRYCAALSALSVSVTAGREEKLHEERNVLNNSLGGGAFHDGMVRQRIEEIDAELAALTGSSS